jgi:hypothetical protein
MSTLVMFQVGGDGQKLMALLRRPQQQWDTALGRDLSPGYHVTQQCPAQEEQEA